MEEDKAMAIRQLPRHIGVIPDGNRRWARERGIPLAFAYRIGADKVEEFLEWCLEYGIRVVTVYILSSENLTRRSRIELEILFALLKERLRKVRNDNRIHENEVRVRVVGRKWLLPKDVLEEAEKTEEETSRYNRHCLNLAIAYGGRQEIIDAVRRIAEDVRMGRLSPWEIDERVFTRYTYLDCNGEYVEPDLIIRTGGERRLSNFLLYHVAYSEIYFTEKYWPDFTRQDFEDALRDYSARIRRFGG